MSDLLISSAFQRDPDVTTHLWLGDEAIAQAAIDAGLSGVFAYPGTPSTEITEYIQQSVEARERGIRSQWSCNEKTAMEAALGMSFSGKRAMVCMKHVGLNVASDAFINSAVTGANGGLVVVAADDPSMHSSQNEQDSRFYGSFAQIPFFEPSSQQEAYDIVLQAFDRSEQHGVPILIRLTTRMAHSRADVIRRVDRRNRAGSFFYRRSPGGTMPNCWSRRSVSKRSLRIRHGMCGRTAPITPWASSRAVLPLIIFAKYTARGFRTR